MEATLEDNWQSIPIKERDKIYQFFFNMKDQEVFEIEKVKPENREKFIIIAKYFQKWERQFFIISLNKESTAIKKFVKV